MFVEVSVDDIVAGGEDLDAAMNIKGIIGKQFDIRDLGRIHD